MVKKTYMSPLQDVLTNAGPGFKRMNFVLSPPSARGRQANRTGTDNRDRQIIVVGSMLLLDRFFSFSCYQGVQQDVGATLNSMFFIHKSSCISIYQFF